MSWNFFSFGDYNFYLKFGFKKIRKYEILEGNLLEKSVKRPF